MAEMIVYDVQTQQQEIIEYDEPVIDEPIKPEPTLEEKLQEVQNDILNMQSVLINQKISGGGITITDSSALRISDFAIQGKTVQASTEGKNLFDISKFPFEHDTETISIKENEGLSGIRLIDIFEENTQYVVSFESYKNIGANPKNSVLFEFVYTDGTKSESYTHLTPKTGFASTNGKSIDYLWIRNPWKAGTEITKLQVEKGNVVTVYEPYTGGEPSPSIEYPQEIMSAGKLNEKTGKYEIDVQVTGRNLINVDVLRNDNGYVTSSYSVSRDINNFDIVQGKKYLLITKGKPLVSGEYSSIYFGEDDLKYGANDKNCLATGTGYVCFTGGKQIRTILTAKKTCTITKMILHGRDYAKDGYEVEELGLFEILEDNTNIDYETYREPQAITIKLDQPLAKCDRIEKRDGVFGVVYKSTVVDDLSTLVTGKEPIYGAEGNKYFVIGMDNADFNYDKTKVFSEVGINNGNYTPKINTGSFIIGINDTDTIETAKEHLHYKVIYETDTEEFVQLQKETQTALNAMHTNYPTTVIANSEDCEMEVTYVCDTKTYVDKQIQGIVAKQIETNKLILERTM